MKRGLSITVLILASAMLAIGQGNAFSFQGRLNDGNTPANGAYDLQFKLYDAIAGGNQIGSMVDRPNTVLANGVFSVTLDFGPAAFNNPASVFIEIAVKPNGSPNAYTILGPRQQLTVVPFAVRAMNATNADNATNAQNAVNANHSASTDIATFAYDATNATNANNSLNLGGVAASGYARLNFANTGNLTVTGNLVANGSSSVAGDLLVAGNSTSSGNVTLISDILLTGNARSISSESNGFVKAMIAFDGTNGGGVVRCYNGITNSSTGNCGFTVSFPIIGVFRINFGFPVSNRFITVTPRYFGTGGNTNNSGANYREFDSTSIEVFTFASGNSADTEPRSFTLILY